MCVFIGIILQVMQWCMDSALALNAIVAGSNLGWQGLREKQCTLEGDPVC